MRLKLLLLIAIFMLFGTTVVNAVSTDIMVDIVPPNPAPNENVTINLKSYAYDLNSVLISWSLNGKASALGIGKKSFSTVAGKAGEEKNVVVTISLPDGTTDTKITIKPSVMVLLWQANDSYVPPFYKGKAMPTLGSQIKIVAMPEIRNGTQIVNSKNIVYVWKRDYTNKQDDSG